MSTVQANVDDMDLLAYDKFNYLGDPNIFYDDGNSSTCGFGFGNNELN